MRAAAKQTASYPPDAAPNEILFFLSINGLGGTELSLLSVAEGLRMRGLPVAVCIYGSRTDLVQKKYPALPVENLGVSRTVNAFLPLCRALLRRKPSVLITALHIPNILALVAACVAGAKTRIVVTEHSPVNPEYLASIGWKYRFLRPVMRCLYRHAAAIVTVSERLADDMRALVGANVPVRVIYNPVVTRGGIPDSPPPHPWLEDKSHAVVMSVGRLCWEKNFDVLLKAFARLIKRKPARLIILGEGYARPSLEALADSLGIKGNILLPGFIESVPSWLTHADIFVSSSRYEGFGNAIVEAMHAHVPVVATDCPVGPAEILDGGRLGRLVPVADDAAMAEAIEAALEMPNDLDAAHARAGEFTIERSVAGYETLIRELAP